MLYSTATCSGITIWQCACGYRTVTNGVVNDLILKDLIDGYVQTLKVECKDSPNYQHSFIIEDLEDFWDMYCQWCHEYKNWGNNMAKSKFTYSPQFKESEKTLDTSTIIKDFGWYEQKISLAELIQLAGDIDHKNVYVELSFMNDPYSENPHMLLTGDKNEQ
jgi:hypothetical protein